MRRRHLMEDDEEEHWAEFGSWHNRFPAGTRFRFDGRRWINEAEEFDYPERQDEMHGFEAHNDGEVFPISQFGEEEQEMDKMEDIRFKFVGDDTLLALTSGGIPVAMIRFSLLPPRDVMDLMYQVSSHDFSYRKMMSRDADADRVEPIYIEQDSYLLNIKDAEVFFNKGIEVDALLIKMFELASQHVGSPIYYTTIDEGDETNVAVDSLYYSNGIKFFGRIDWENGSSSYIFSNVDLGNLAYRR